MSEFGRVLESTPSITLVFSIKHILVLINHETRLAIYIAQTWVVVIPTVVVIDKQLQFDNS